VELKRCGCCKTEKPTTEFFKDKTKPSGLTSACKVCRYQQKLKSLSEGDRLAKRSEHYKEWYQANREILLQKKREKRKDPIEKEKNKLIKAKWIEAMGPEAYTAWRKKLRVKYRDKIAAYNKAVNIAFPDCEVRSEIRRNSKFAKLTNEEIPHEMIEVYRLLRFIRRGIKNEDLHKV
jgi:hypothetical protein